MLLCNIVLLPWCPAQAHGEQEPWLEPPKTMSQTFLSSSRLFFESLFNQSDTGIQNSVRGDKDPELVEVWAKHLGRRWNFLSGKRQLEWKRGKRKCLLGIYQELSTGSVSCGMLINQAGRDDQWEPSSVSSLWLRWPDRTLPHKEIEVWRRTPGCLIFMVSGEKSGNRRTGKK